MAFIHGATLLQRISYKGICYINTQPENITTTKHCRMMINSLPITKLNQIHVQFTHSKSSSIGTNLISRLHDTWRELREEVMRLRLPETDIIQVPPTSQKLRQVTTMSTYTPLANTLGTILLKNCNNIVIQVSYDFFYINVAPWIGLYCTINVDPIWGNIIPRLLLLGYCRVKRHVAPVLGWSRTMAMLQ